MRDLDVVEQELRLLAAVSRTIRDESGGDPGDRQINALLDERSVITRSEFHQ